MGGKRPLYEVSPPIRPVLGIAMINDQAACSEGRNLTIWDRGETGITFGLQPDVPGSTPGGSTNNLACSAVGLAPHLPQ